MSLFSNSNLQCLKVVIKSLPSLHTMGKKRQQQVEQKKTKRPTQNLYSKERAGFVQSELTLRGLGRVTLRLWVHYLFGCLLLFHTIPNYNIYYFPAKPLHYAFKATLFSCKNTNKQGEEGGSQGQRGQSSEVVCLPGWPHALHPSHRQSQHM